jgi:hypothetical protein
VIDAKPKAVKSEIAGGPKIHVILSIDDQRESAALVVFGFICKSHKMSQPQYNLTVLISGNGSNLQALIDACASSAIPNTRITHVISKCVFDVQHAKELAN